MKKVIMILMMTVISVISMYGQQPVIPEGTYLKELKTGGYIITPIPERSTEPITMNRTDGHYFNIVPTIQGNKKEVEVDTLTNQEVDSHHYMYDEVTRVICAKFDDDNVCYYGNEDALFKEFLYDQCYECIDNGNDLYCEIYYYYDKDENRLTGCEKHELVILDDEERREIKDYKERCDEIKSFGLPLAEQQKSLDHATDSYQSSLKSIKKRRDEMTSNYINIELRRAMYIRDIIYKSYPARIKFVKVNDIVHKNKIGIVISNYKDEYRKN